MPRRSASLDAMRGLAVLFMLEVHLGFWWARNLPEGNPLVDLGTVLGGTAAPLFLILAGIGLSLSRAREPSGFLARSARRGFALLVAGVIFTFVEQVVYGPFGWGVLQCIGVSVIVCAAAMRAPPSARALAGVALMILASVLRWQLGVPGVLYSNDMMAVGSAGDYLRGMLLSGFFPLIPWLGFALVGSAAGDWLFIRGSENPRDRAGAVNLFLLSFFLIVSGAAVLSRGTAPEFFPPSLSFSLLVCGVCLLAVPIFTAVRFPGGNPLSALGRVSLTAFVVHHLVGFEAFRAAGLLHSFDLTTALALVLLTWALALLAAWAWSRKGFRYGLEWAVGLLERRTSK